VTSFKLGGHFCHGWHGRVFRRESASEGRFKWFWLSCSVSGKYACVCTHGRVIK